MGDLGVLVHNDCKLHRNDAQHGGEKHWNEIVKKYDSMQASGNYSEIWVNKRLRG